MRVEPITRIRLQRFTAFEELELQPASGINVLTGVNGTGKTHLMKVLYAACEASRKDVSFAAKLQSVFMPWQGRIGRTARRGQGNACTCIRVERGDRHIQASYGVRTRAPSSAVVRMCGWRDETVHSAYIPVKEMLANAPGFVSLYDQRSVHFEEVYRDILMLASLPPYRGAPDAARKPLLKQLRDCLGGSIALESEVFFLKGRQGNLEFSLLAEGLRKLGLLWVLIQNGTLAEGSILFWDEPEANLNPQLFDKVVRVLLELRRSMGVQVFIATHNYALLKQLDLQAKAEDAVAFHALYLGESGAVACRSVDSYLALEPNAITAAYDTLYDLEIARTLRGGE